MYVIGMMRPCDDHVSYYADSEREEGFFHSCYYIGWAPTPHDAFKFKYLLSAELALKWLRAIKEEGAEHAFLINTETNEWLA